MANLEDVLPAFKNGEEIRRKCWNENLCISLQGSCGININFYDVNADDWEVVIKKSIDWKYIIDYRCLCWFWDDNFNWAICGTLGKIEKGSEYGFIMFDDEGNRSPYKNCRPVRINEVNFYKEKE